MNQPVRTSLYEASHLRDLTELLRQIHARETALPDFQRDFVWDTTMTQDLIVSITYNHAAGSVWLIRNTQRVFVWRKIEGAPPLESHQPTFLVLDGQQRLTALYRVFYGVGPRRYYVNLRRLIDGAAFEDCIFHRRAESRPARAYENLHVQARELVLPLSLLKGGLGDFVRWSRQLARMRATDRERNALEDALSEVAESWVRSIDAYQFPVVTLSETTGVEAVCRMFEKLNGKGVKLGPFELLTARFWPQDISLRRLWVQARSDHPIIAEFGVDPYYILQIVSLVTSSPPVCTLKNVLTLQASTIEEWWDRAVQSLARGLEILRGDCGVIAPKWFPYKTILLPLAAVLAKLTRPASPEAGAIRQKLVQWFWCSMFGKTYEQASNTQAARDVVELLSWCDGGEPPESVRRFHFDPHVLRQATPPQRAHYHGTLCLILSRGPRDLHSGAKLTADVIAKYRIDSHHVFPRAYLDRQGVDVRLRDCVLNRTLIDRTSNQSLQMRAPADYLAQIQASLGPEKSRELLQSHLLPGEPNSPLWRDDFEGFLARRQDLVWQAIQEVTGLTHAPSATEATEPQPGGCEHTTPMAGSAREGTNGAVGRRGAPQSLDEYLAGQSDRTQRLYQSLDRGIRAFASDITAKVTRGRRSVGGVSYYSPERCFLCADFIHTGDGLTLSVFTGGQPWEGVNPSASSPWGSLVVPRDADLPSALAVAEAAYQAIKRTMRGPKPITGHPSRRRDGHGW